MLCRILIIFLGMVSLQCYPTSWHFTPNDVNELHSESADYRIAYGRESSQFGDLRLPNGKGPFPVAIIIHGGCWVSKFADLQNTAALADALRANGIATWNIEYRSEDNVGGGWPGTFEDVANASDFLRNIASTYSLDLNSVIVIGQSAGGHLALWLAARNKLRTSNILYAKNPIKLRGAIAMGGVPDLKTFRQHGQEVCGTDVIGKLLGLTESQIMQHYQEASPINLLPLSVPQVLIYGADDQVVPALFAYHYKEIAVKKGDKVKLIEVKYAAHHEYNVPNSVTWPVIVSAIKSMLK